VDSRQNSLLPRSAPSCPFVLSTTRTALDNFPFYAYHDITIGSDGGLAVCEKGNGWETRAVPPL